MEQNDIFAYISKKAGDIVFKYCYKNGWFEQFSNVFALEKHGTKYVNGKTDFIYPGMIHEDDLNFFNDCINNIKTGKAGNIDGIFRMRINASSDYRWYRLYVQTVYENELPLEAIGRITDVNEVINRFDKIKNISSTYENDMQGIVDREAFLGEIVKYGKTHNSGTLGCILINIPAYDNVINRSTKQEAKEFNTNLIRRIRRAFPYGAYVGRIGVHRFGVFVGGMSFLTDVGPSIDKVRANLKELGVQYNVMIHANLGVCFENYTPGIEDIVFERATEALENADRKGIGIVEFYNSKKAEDKNDTAKQSGKGLFSDVLSFLRLGQKHVDKANVSLAKTDATQWLDILIDRVRQEYGIERISVSLKADDEYKEFKAWSSTETSNMPDWCLLHVNGKAKDIEGKISTEIPYIVNDVSSYPDDSEYGRMLNITSVKSVAQIRFVCTNGMTGIVSIEKYSGSYTWHKEELVVLEVSKYIAEICSRYR